MGTPSTGIPGQDALARYPWPRIPGQGFLARDLMALENPPAGDDDEDLEVLQMSPAELDARLSSGEEWLDGKSVTAWYRAKQLLGF